MSVLISVYDIRLLIHNLLYQKPVDTQSTSESSLFLSHLVELLSLLNI